MSSRAEVKGKSTFQILGRGLVLPLVVLLASWATAALYFDLPAAAWRGPAAAIFGIFVVLVLAVFRGRWSGLTIAAAGSACVLIWWLSLQPSNDRIWQPDVARTAWAEINGNQVTIHNLRNCDYRTESDYTPVWETRTVELSQLRGVDVFMTYWGSPWIAHPIVSFDFGDEGHVAISVETRKQVGESYSAIRGFFRYYELIYTIADERDVVCTSRESSPVTYHSLSLRNESISMPRRVPRIVSRNSHGLFGRGDRDSRSPLRGGSTDSFLVMAPTDVIRRLTSLRRLFAVLRVNKRKAI